MKYSLAAVLLLVSTPALSQEVNDLQQPVQDPSQQQYAVSTATPQAPVQSYEVQPSQEVTEDQDAESMFYYSAPSEGEDSFSPISNLNF